MWQSGHAYTMDDKYTEHLGGLSIFYHFQDILYYSISQEHYRLEFGQFLSEREMIYFQTFQAVSIDR